MTTIVRYQSPILMSPNSVGLHCHCATREPLPVIALDKECYNTNSVHSCFLMGHRPVCYYLWVKILLLDELLAGTSQPTLLLE